MKKHSPAFEPLMQALILFGLACYFIGVIFSGSVYRYVHERHVPIMYSSAAVFLLIGILKLKQAVQLYHLHTASYKDAGRNAAADTALFALSPGRIGIFGTAVFVLALTGMIAMPNMGINLSQFAYTDSLGAAYTASNAPLVDSDAGGAFAAQGTAVQNSVQQNTPAQAVPIRNIVMNEDTFSTWLSVLYTRLDSCVGAKITISGSVWKDGTLFEQNEFAVARMMMVCCAADLQPVGLLAEWDNVQSLADGEWVEITGTLGKKPYKDGFDPLIMVESVKKIDAPEREYIYQ